MKTNHQLLAAFALGICLHVPPAFAGSPTKQVQPPETATERSGWQFRLQPYLWTTRLDGSTGVAGLSTEVDVGFDKIFENLEMAAALEVEARNGRWGIWADGFYAQLGPEGDPPGPFYEGVEVELRQFIGQIAVAYRLVEGPAGFVDLYAGVRWNYLSVDLSADVDQAGVRNFSEQASAKVVDRITAQARQAAQRRLAQIRSTAASARNAARTAIESQLATTLRDGLRKELVALRSQVPDRAVRLDILRVERAVARERATLASATADAEIAKVRAAVNSKLQSASARARARVAQAEKKLADAIEKELNDRLPASASGEQDWLDPLVGIRARWNITERVYLAAAGDVGGFGAGSDFAWLAQATVGYRLSEHLFTEIGYRHYQVDYTDGGFSYDLAQSGAYLALGFQF